jgi:hypothetical protein
MAPQKKSYLTVAALALVAKTAVLGVLSGLAVDAGASKPCSPDPAVPCVSPPPPVRVARIPPSDLADVVGRDLSVQRLEFLGHVGLYSGTDAARAAYAAPTSTYWLTRTISDRIYEMLDDGRGITANPFSDFKERSNFWGSFYFNNWSARPAQRPCVRVRGTYDSRLTECVSNSLAVDAENQPAKVIAILRAHAIYSGGATYTLSPIVRETEISVDLIDSLLPQYLLPPVRGQYRCDTFITSVFDTAGLRRQIDYVGGQPGAITESLYRRGSGGKL